MNKVEVTGHTYILLCTRCTLTLVVRRK